MSLCCHFHFYQVIWVVSVACYIIAFSLQRESASDSDGVNDSDGARSKISKRVRAETPEPTPTSRWKYRQTETYARSKRKIRRNLGQQYISDKTKKPVAARELGPPCGCKKRCGEKLDGNEENIFNEFWNLGSWDLQNVYLFGCIGIAKKKRSYKKKQKRQESSRSCNAVYSINVNGQSVEVCKTEFLNIHGLQKSKGRLNNIVSKKIRGTSIPEKDKRGKHENRPNQINDQRKESVRRHIDLIPKYQSHYSRAENLGKVYLNCDMTISRLYSDFYVPWCQKENIEPVLEHTYRKIFCTEYNIGFKLPKSDTCKTCDQLNIRLDSARNKNEIEELSRLNTELILHKTKAKAMQDLLHNMTLESKNKSRTLVISFDLQQAMPLPKLTTGPAFYSRKVWMYNLGIHDCTAGKGHMFLWTEDTAKRGSDEVASILLKFLLSTTEIDDLIIFTDNCPGQNKNWLLMSLWLQLVKENKFKTITHYFLVSGHTHLPSDRDFALIEKCHRKYAPQVFSPNEWYNIICKSNKKTPFTVTVMKQEDFLNFAPLLANIKKSSQTDHGNNVNFANAFAFRFINENTKVFYIKHSVHGEYEQVSIMKRGRPVQTSLDDLIRKYLEPIKISKKKINNVMSLLPYIPPVHHSFFQNLQADLNQDLEATDEPEIINETE